MAVVEDAKSVMEIGGTSITNFYDSKKIDTRTFVFSADCASEDFLYQSKKLNC